MTTVKETSAERAFESRPADSFEFEDILYEKADGVARVTINRPHNYNAYSTPALEELATAFRDASFDDGVGVIVYTGAGDRAFCTGGDVKEYADLYIRTPRDYWKYMALFRALHRGAADRASLLRQRQFESWQPRPRPCGRAELGTDGLPGAQQQPRLLLGGRNASLAASRRGEPGPRDHFFRNFNNRPFFESFERILPGTAGSGSR